VPDPTTRDHYAAQNETRARTSAALAAEPAQARRVGGAQMCSPTNLMDADCTTTVFAAAATEHASSSACVHA
jgi:hypothetical protein